MQDEYLDVYTLKPGQYRELPYSKYLSAVYLDVDKVTKLYFPRDLVPPPVVHDYTIDKVGATFTMNSHEEVPTYIWRSKFVASVNDYCMILVQGPNNNRLRPNSYIAYPRKYFKDTVLANTTKSPGDHPIGFEISVYSNPLLLPTIYCFEQLPLFQVNQTAQPDRGPKPIQFSFTSDAVFGRTPPRKRIMVNDETSPFKRRTKDWYHKHTTYHPRKKLISNEYSSDDATALSPSGGEVRSDRSDEASESSDHEQNPYDPREAEYRDNEVRNQPKVSPNGVYMSTDRRPGTKSVVVRKTNGSLQEYRVGKRAMTDIRRKLKQSQQHSLKHSQQQSQGHPAQALNISGDEYSSDDARALSPSGDEVDSQRGLRDRTRDRDQYSYESQDNSNTRTPKRSSRVSSRVSAPKHSSSVKFGKSFKPYREKFTPQFKGNTMDTTFEYEMPPERSDEYSEQELSSQYEEEGDPEATPLPTTSEPEPVPPRRHKRNAKIISKPSQKRENFFDRFKQ